MRRVRLFVPLAVFAVMLVFLYRGFSLEDPHDLPSALIGEPFPAFSLPALSEPGRTLTRASLVGEIRLVNVWATWCPTCMAEHDELKRIARESGVSVVGINYKDSLTKARAWLARFGNPYDFNIVDAKGRLAVDLGVYGAPETFLVDADGTIVYKRVGEVNRRVWKREIAPALAALTGAGRAEG